MGTTGGDRGPDRLDVYRVSYVIWSREGGGYQRSDAGRGSRSRRSRAAGAPVPRRATRRVGSYDHRLPRAFVLIQVQYEGHYHKGRGRPAA